jgi:hypothetical protein
LLKDDVMKRKRHKIIEFTVLVALPDRRELLTSRSGAQTWRFCCITYNPHPGGVFS